MPLPKKAVLDLSEIDEHDAHLFGEKAENLVKLKRAGFPVIDSFVITSKALHDFLKENDLELKIRHLINALGSADKAQEYIRKHIIEGQFSGDLIKDIVGFYKKLGGILEHSSVDIHHSQNHNLPPFLGVKGEATLLHKIKEAWSELFENAHLNFNPTLLVQKSVKLKKGKIQTDNLKTLSPDLKKLGSDLKSFYYFPYEIEYVVENGQVFLTKSRPKTPEPETAIFKIINNTAWIVG